MAGGRPSKLNEKLTEKICNDIRAGNYPATAAVINGIDESTFYIWMKKGRESKTKKGKFFEFFKTIKEAEHFAQAYHLQNIRKAGEEGNWQASAWWLERKFPKEWSKKDYLALEHSGKIKNEHSGKIKIDGNAILEKINPEHLKAKRKAMDELYDKKPK